MANDKVFIFDDENIRINVYEESRTNVHLINDNPSIEVVRIYEPGPQGAKGNDGGEFILPDNVISSSNQIASDISGSFTVVSESLSQRINFFENKNLISGSDQLSSVFELRGNNIVSASNQLTSSYDLRYELRGVGILSSSNGFISSSQQVKDNLPVGTVSSSNQLSSVFEAKGSNLLSSSQQIAAEISGSFDQASSSFQSRISTIESKTLVSGSQQIKNLLPTGVVSGSEQLTSSYDNRYHRLGTGLFSSSQQVTYEQLSNVPSGILSSSNGFISASSQVDFTGIINKPTLLSGSGQVIYGQIQNIPAGIVSGSDQISSSYDSKYETRGRGIISSSNGFISSSAQVDYALIQNTPTTILSASYALTASYVSGSSNSSISSSYSVSSSYALSASYAPQAALPTGLLSSSQQINLLLPNLVSGSDQLSGSYDTRYERKGSSIVSSSLQLASDISGSVTSKIEPLNTFTGSIQTRVQRLEQVTSSLFSFTSSANTRLDRIESVTASYNTFTASISTLVNRLESATGSYALKTEVSGAFTNVSSSLQGRIAVFEGKTLFSASQQVNYTQLLNIPSGILSSSNGFISSSQQVKDNLPSGTVSSSQQINSGSFSGSFNGNGSGLTGINSSSYALTASYALNGGGGTNVQTIGIRIKTEDTYITEGSKGFKHIGYNSNITKLRGIANIAGTINLNVKRDGNLLGNYNLTGASSSIDTTLTGWTTSLNANDLIEFSVSQSSTYITDLTFFMDLQSI